MKKILPLVTILFFMPQLAHAAIQLVGTTTASGTTAAYNLSLTSLQGGIASSPAQDDIVIVVNVLKAVSDGNPGVGTAGYTEMTDLHSDDTHDTEFSVSYKIMGASPDSSVSCNPSTSGSFASDCFAVVFRGVDTSTPMDVSSTTARGTDTEDIDCPSITPTTSGALVVCLGGAAGASVASGITWPAGYTQAAVISTDPSTAAAGLGAYKSWSGSGAEDPAAFSFSMGNQSQNSWAALTLALRPAVSIVAPTVTTDDITPGTIAATLLGTISATGGANPTVRGFAWGTNATLQTTFATTSESGSFGTGQFSQSVGALISGTTYYYRAYATNSGGTGFGSIKSFVAGSDTAPTRKMRVFEGFKLKLINGTLKLY